MRKLHLNNLCFEEELSKNRIFWKSRKNSPFLALQYLPLFYMDKKDALLTAKKPSIDYLGFLKEKGFYQDQQIFEIGDRISPEFSLDVWGATESVKTWAETLKIPFPYVDPSIAKALQSKGFFLQKGAKILKKAPIFSRKNGKFLYKEFFGFSGKNQSLTLENLQFPLKRELLKIPELEYSSHWHLPKKEEPLFLGCTLLFSPKRSFEKALTLCPSYLRSFPIHEKKVRSLMKSAKDLGYFGPLSFDGFDHSGSKHYLSEINARKTMSSTLLLIQKKRATKTALSLSYLPSKKRGGLLPKEFNRQLFLQAEEIHL